MPDTPPADTDDERTLSGEKPLGPALVESLGGKRGLVDSGLPAVVFVGVNAVVDAFAARSTALHVAIAAAVACGLGVVVLRLVRKETVQQAVSGFLGLAIAVFFAARSGQARDFFKPGIYINAAYGAVFLGSVLVRRPLVGAIYSAVDGLGSAWRTDRRLLRVFSVATVGWALVFALRAVVQTVFYNADRPDLLAISKLLLGWPLTIAAVAATIAFVRRSHLRAGLPADR
ncbi:MAG: hypothetical protein QOE84_1248 [Actinomycetota bacterium]|nr:hypothetical protein [Actinomycetota bacterium]MDT7548854.1 hypothetical protein [Actinomycetota bacterium]